MNKYITKEEYLNAKGVNLEIELQDDDNKSNKVQRFIHEVTDWCLEYLILEYGNNELNGLFQNLPEFRQKYFREGVMEQIEYILNEGWINKSAGYNGETGMIVNLGVVQLGRTAFQKFRLGAFCNIERY